MRKDEYCMKKTAIVLLILFGLLVAGCRMIERTPVRPDSAPKKDGSALPSNAAAPDPQPASGPASAPQPVSEPAPEAEPETADVLAACGNYQPALRESYDAYQQANPRLSPQEVVAQVNLGLNRPFYTEIETIANPDDLLVLCNKYRALPADYEPADLKALAPENTVSGRTIYLREEAAAAFGELCAGAKAAGYTILGQSGYRSYGYQKTLYNNYSARDGQTQADTYSARPGHSEHQTGLAIDIRNASLPYTSFGKALEYQWMKDNSYKYGFVLHYLPDKQNVTGYQTEEWHYRYVGMETAAKVWDSGLTYDEYWALFISGSEPSSEALL